MKTTSASSSEIEQAVDIALRVRPEVDGELAVLLVLRRIEAIIVEVAQGELKLVEAEVELVVL